MKCRAQPTNPRSQAYSANQESVYALRPARAPTPFAHIRNVDERTVSHGLHGSRWLPARRCIQVVICKGPAENGARQTAFRQRR